MERKSNGQSRVSANAKCEKMTCPKSYRRSIRLFDVLCVMFSMGTLIADFVTDILVAFEYWNRGDFYWFAITTTFVIMPSVIIQVFSIRWFMMDDDRVTFWHWLSHFTCFGIIHRYIQITKTALEARQSKSPQDYQRLFSQQSDLYMLHLFESCLEAAPQFVFQMYITAYAQNLHTIVVISSGCSIASITCAAFAYGQGHIGNESTRSGIEGSSVDSKITSMLLKATWRLCTFSARIMALIMFALLFNAWIFIPLACHWLTMTMWIIYQKTNFCSTKFEEILYNSVVGFMYCFCYFNLKDGQTRYRIITFYSITVTQNVAIFVAFLLLSNFDSKRKMTLSIVGFVTIIGGTIMGLCSMMIYYRWFHPVGSIKWKCERNGNRNVESGTESSTDAEMNTQTIRSLKQTQEKDEICASAKPSNNLSEQSQLKPECTDKKLLLHHWIARTGTPTFASVPISNEVDSSNISGVEFHSVNNSFENNDVRIAFHKQNDGNSSNDNNLAEINTMSKKRKAICSPSDLGLNITKSNMHEVDPEKANNIQKRRGICSSDELTEGLNILPSIGDSSQRAVHSKSIDKNSQISHDTDSSNKKTSSDSIDCDLDLSFSDINSSDINEFNENIVQKLCLSTLKNIKDGNQDADIKNIQRIAVDILKEMYCKKGDEKSNKSLVSFDFNALTRDLDTPSELLSVHDYENICAVNIAREAWGLRSWGCYSDIENWLHDDSIVRDRRLDTLTSASSEICSNLSMDRHNCSSPPPVPARKPTIYSNILVGPSRERQVDYIDTLVYEMAKCEDSICDGARINRNIENHTALDSNIFIAKPYVIDQNGSMLPLTVPLEPILEELDDITEHHENLNKKKRLNSESSLVATIDEIRKDTLTNSPRNVYHRTENIWDSPQLHIKQNLRRNLQTTNLNRNLWKDKRNNTLSNVEPAHKLPTKSKDVHRINSLKSLKNDENLDAQLVMDNVSSSPKSTVILGQKVLRIKNQELSSALGSNGAIPFKRRTKSGLKSSSKAGEHDLSRKEVLFLSNLVVDTKNSSLTNLDDPNNYISSSLQSLIAKDSNLDSVPPSNNTDNVLRTNKNLSNRPRRKFSLLRERFESKTIESDKEILFNNLENKVNSQSDLNIESDCINGGNSIKDISDEIQCCLQKEIIPQMPSLGCQTGVPGVLSQTCDKNNSSSSCSNILKQKRSLFLKQVLSPQKFNNWSKK